MELIGFFSIWYELGRWPQIRKYIVRISATIVCQKISERMGAMSDGGADGAHDPCLHRVFPHRLMQKRIGMRRMKDYVVEIRPCCVAPMQRKCLATNLSSSLVMISSGKMALLLQ